MTDQPSLGLLAARVAECAAMTYLERHHLHADPQALAVCLRSWCKIKLPEALTDVRQALDAHMDTIAEWSFMATMGLAGIEAAKEAGVPSGV